MRNLFLVSAIAVFALSGCSAATPEPEHAEAPTVQVEEDAEPLYSPTATAEDEALFLADSYDTLPEKYKSDELRSDVIQMGHDYCLFAAEDGTTTDVIATDDIATLDKEDPVWMYNMTLRLLVGKKAGEVFCPQYAAAS